MVRHHLSLQQVDSTFRCWAKSDSDEVGFVDRWSVHLESLCHAVDLASIPWYRSAAAHLFARIVHVDRLEYGSPPQGRLANEAAISLSTGGAELNAERMLRWALRTRIEVFGPDRPEVGLTLNTLANTCNELGDYECGLEMSQRAAAVFENAVGSAHPQFGRCLVNAGVAYQGLGNHHEAIQCYLRALLVFVLDFQHGPTHRLVGQSLANLGVAYTEKGWHRLSLAALARAESIYLRTWTTTNRSCPWFGQILGRVYSELGMYGMALNYYGRALSLKETLFGTDHPQVAITLNNMAAAHLRQEDTELASSTQCSSAIDP